MAHAVLRLIRLPQVMDATGLRSTSIYARAKAGLLTPPIKLTPRSSAWPEHEIAAVNAAIIAGASDDELRALVRQLIVERSDRVGAKQLASTP